MRLIFLGRLRDVAQCGEMSVDLPPDVVTGEDLITWLSAREPQLGAALTSREVRIAIDHTLAARNDAVASAHEVAFMPPFSGG